MNVSRSEMWICCGLAAVLLGGLGNRVLGQGGGGDAPPILDAKKMRMQPEDAVAPLKIFGGSSKEGFYIYRNRFAPHATSRPHYHYDGSMDDSEVIVQLMGYGPVTTVQTEVDEKGNPVGNNPKNPNRGRGRRSQ